MDTFTSTRSSASSSSEFQTLDLDLAAFLSAAGYRPLRVVKSHPEALATFAFPRDQGLSELIVDYSSGLTTPVPDVHKFISARRTMLTLAKGATIVSEGAR